MKKIVYLLVALDDHCKVHRLILVASMNEIFLKDPKFMLACTCTARLSPGIEVKSCLQSTDPQEPLFNFLLLHYSRMQTTYNSSHGPHRHFLFFFLLVLLLLLPLGLFFPLLLPLLLLVLFWVFFFPTFFPSLSDCSL
jgi:hypothetical protein